MLPSGGIFYTSNKLNDGIQFICSWARKEITAFKEKMVLLPRY